MNEDDVCLNADHTGIVRYPDGNDDNYLLLVQQLQDIIESIQGIAMPVGDSTKLPDTSRNLVTSATKYFVGHQADLQVMHDLFFSSKNVRHAIVALYGPSGMGKTELALKFSEDNAASYHYTILLDASSPEDLRADLSSLHLKLDLTERSTDAVSEVTQFLAREGSPPWLMIFDNANGLKEVWLIISTFLPFGHIIVTTQDSRISSSELFDDTIEIKKLSEEESNNLLCHRADLPLGAETEAVTTVIQELGCLPLAIDSAGAYIRTLGKSIGEYEALLKRCPKEIFGHRPELSSHPASVLAFLGMVLAKIDSKSHAGILLSLLASLDCSEVTGKFLHRGTSHQPRWNSQGEKEWVDPLTRNISTELITLCLIPLKLDAAIETLMSFSLIQQRTKQQNGRAFTLHPLVHKCANLCLSDEDRVQNMVNAMSILAQAYPSVVLGFEDEYGTKSVLFMRRHMTESLLDATDWVVPT